MASRARARARPRRRRAWLRRLLGWMVKALLVFLVGSLLWVLAYRFVNPPLTFTMIGDLIDGRGARRHWVPIEGIDPDLVRAAIAGEDSRFCSHGGFDRQAIEAAMRRNLAGGSVLRGGSTISQQTAKNAFLWQGGGWFRKGLEAWFTILIENLWDKRRIMEVYLNVAETGIGTYGVEAGARRYFGRGAGDLTPEQAARIAAVLPLPKRREAIAPTGFTRRYGNMILARMAVVRRERLDGCVQAGAQPAAEPSPPPRAPRAAPAPAREPVPSETIERPQAPPPEPEPPTGDPPPFPPRDEAGPPPLRTAS